MSRNSLVADHHARFPKPAGLPLPVVAGCDEVVVKVQRRIER
jgi:hypothetical protein